MNAYDRLMLEAIPQGFPPPVDTSDGPTACMMRVERQRLLWQLASDNATADPVESDPQSVDAGVDVGVVLDDQNMSNHNESVSA